MSASVASFLAVLLSFGLAACAPTTRQPPVSDQLIEQEAAFQREMAFSEALELKDRLGEVGMNVAIGAAPLCGRRVTNTLGMDYLHYTAAKPEFRLAARRVLQSDEYPVISSVAAGGPAARARISVGDKLVQMDDWTVPKAGNVMKAVDEKMQEIAAKGGEHQIGVLRGTSRLSFKVTAVPRCNCGIALTEDDQMNAFANGSTILVTTGMMRFLKNDDELALILGHEMAHNILAHQAKQQGNMLLGALLGFARSAIRGVDVVGTQAQAGADAYSRAFEAEADYVGMYYAARAGYRTRSAATMWRRMATLHPSIINDDHDHPSTAERFVSLEAASAEIAWKMSIGEALIPNSR